MQPPKDSIHPKNRQEWREWLVAHHSRNEGIWLITFKKSSGLQVLTFEEGIEEALCFGWIDSKPRKLDKDRTMLWFAPRKPASGWSRINKERLKKMMETGRMTLAGLEKIEAAKKDGSWDLLDSVDALEVPKDLKIAFSRFKSAQKNFDAFPKSARRGILEWIIQAKKPETRSRRVLETAELAEKGERANQWRPKS